MFYDGYLRKDRGFTLVEIMMVVAIIGLLAAVAIPWYRNMVEQATSKVCLAQQKVLFEAASLYELGERGSLKNVGDTQARLEALKEKGYIKHAEGFECPASPYVDYDDYSMVFDGDALVDIECDIRPEAHQWP